MSDYERTHRRSIENPGEFWLEAARALAWEREPSIGVDTSASPQNAWFPDGEINACRNALDVHVDAGHGERLALIHDSPVTGTVTRFTYAELRDAVARFAGALRGLGVERGDRVLVYMPMVPEAAIAMLACARIGAVHSVVFGGFAAKELAVRIDDCTPRVVVSASCGIEPARTVPYKPLLDEALEIATASVDACVVLQREACGATLVDGRDHDWHALVRDAAPADCVPMRSTDPLYILYTSGTTGRPKGVVRDTGGQIVALKWTMKAIYDADPGDVYWAASDIGWVVGHSYIVYGPLLQGCTSILYEGKPVGTPDAGAFWRVIAEHRVKTLFTAPRRSASSARPTPRRRSSPSTTSPRSTPSSSPANAATRTRCAGPSAPSTYRSSTTGGRPRPAGRSAPTRAASRSCRSSRAPPRWPPPATISSCSMPTAGRCRAGTSARSAPACRCRRAPSPRSGTRPSATAMPTSAASPVSTRRAMRASSTRTATCSSWRAPTTSSTSPGTASRPGRWRRRWRTTRTWPSAR